MGTFVFSVMKVAAPSPEASLTLQTQLEKTGEEATRRIRISGTRALRVIRDPFPEMWILLDVQLCFSLILAIETQASYVLFG